MNEAGFRTSPQQRWLWEIDPIGLDLRIGCLLQVDPALAANQLSDALNRLVSRHEILRTRLVCPNHTTVPIQVIESSVDIRIDQRPSNTAQQDNAWQRLITESASAGLSAILFSSPSHSSQLLIGIPAWCGDATSLQLLVAELAAILQSSALTAEHDLLQYADVAEVFNALLEDDDTQAGRDFWQGRPQMTQPLRLPFEKTLSAGHRVLATEECRFQVTSFGPWSPDPEALLLACWSLLIQRLSGSEDVQLSVRFHGRTYDGMETACGPYQRYLPITIADGDQQQSLHQRLNGVRQSLNDIQPWQDYYPVTQSAGDIAFSWCRALQLNSPQLALIDHHCRDGRFRIALHCEHAQDGVDCRLHYDPHVLDANHAERLQLQLQSILRQLIDEPGLVLDQLDLHLPGDRLWLDSINDTDASLSNQQRLHHGFERQQRQTPDAMALCIGKVSLSYQQLNQRAENIAARLTAQKTAPDELVAVLMERSIDAVAAIIGILKAGCSWLALDPTSPDARLKYMLADANPRLLIARQANTRRIARLDGHFTADAAPYGDVNVLVRAESQPSHVAGLAYVIYTSGSTGQPKGVLIPHKAICNHLNWRQRVFPLTADDRFLQKAPLGFDIAVWELFAPLSVGATVFLAPAGVEHDIGQLLGYVAEQRVSIAHFGPAMLSLFLDHPQCTQCHSLRDVFCGGESLSASLARKFTAKLTARLHHQYGPTETTVDVTIHSLSADHTYDPIPIGRPIDNTSIELLDAKGRSVPVGVVGEICIGGDSLAIGYLNRQDLTDAAFISHPSATARHSRLYRSGDLGHFNANGELVFCGRLDSQIKIRGFRIEPAEIEAKLQRLDDVEQAAVVSDGKVPSKKRLLAYLAAAPNRTLDHDVIREQLAEQLPDFMVPSLFIELPALPLTARGKLDRKQLPKPSPLNQLKKKTKHVPPENNIQRALADVWCRVLKLDSVSIDANFFHIGGDSIRSIMVVMEAQRKGLSFTAIDLMRNPTVRELAQVAAHVNDTAADNDRPDDTQMAWPAAVDGAFKEAFVDVYPATKMQQFMFEQSARDDGALGVYHVQSVSCVTADALRVDLWVTALEQLHDAHPLLRTAFFWAPCTDQPGAAPQLHQGVMGKYAPQVTRHDLRAVEPKEQEAIVRQAMADDLTKPFAVDHTVPIRYQLFITSDRELRFFISNHHAVRDGWGRVLLLNQLTDLYGKLVAGEPADIPTAESTFREFVSRERKLLKSRRHREFWKRQCSTTAPSPGPAPNSRPQASDPYKSKVVRILKKPLQGAIRHYLDQHQLSGKAFFLDAYFDVIRSMSADSDTTVGVVSNGRTEHLSDPFGSLGLFWNIVPVARPQGLLQTKLERLSALQEHLLHIEPFVTYPLPAIAEDLGGKAPFNATFNYTHFHHQRHASSASSVSIKETAFHDKFHFPLNGVISVDPSSDAIKFRLEYHPNYFDHKTIEALADSYVERIRVTTQQATAGK